MAYQTITATTSRSFSHHPDNSADLSRDNSPTAQTTLGNGAGPWGTKTSSIWRNASLTTPFVPRALATDDNEAKKGSRSLLASSESDTPTWRPGISSNLRLTTPTVKPAFRNDSLDLTRNGISPTTSRTPAINLTNTAFSATRSSTNSVQSPSFYGNGPPTVYSKYRDAQSRPVDSTFSPTSATVSPSSDRAPQWPNQYRDYPSTSQDSTRPSTSASYCSERYAKPGTAESYAPQHRPTTSRSNSILPVQQSTTAVNPEYLPAAFFNLSLTQDPTTARMCAQQPCSSIPYNNTYMDNHERDVRYGHLTYNSPGASTYLNVRYSRDMLKSGLPFEAISQHVRSPDFIMPPKQTWQDMNDTAVARRTMSPEQSLLLDPRIAEQVIALKDQYLYNPYGVQSMHGMSPYLNYYGMAMNEMNESMQSSASDQGVQSAKLYDFKQAGKNNRRYELKDIYNDIAEFAGDQHGSRFIQNKLETANSDEKERVFREIEPNAIPLMTDVFGNYVIQKFFDHGHQEHKKILANKMRGQVLNLSTQMYGCRVVQKALEHVLLEQQAQLVGELEHHVLKCVKDQSGNHVIQKAIERCPPETISFVYKAFVGQVHSLSLHPYGCRVIQRCLERQDNFPAKATILAELHDGMPKGMIGDSYGNYVVQHVVENGPDKDRQHVLNIVLSDLEGYSKHKFASNVVEKCIRHSNDVWRRRVVEILTTVDDRRAEGEGVLVGLIKDSFGNYVIQKLLECLSSQDFMYFHQHLQPAMAYTKRMGSGKQVVSIEKKMQRFESLLGRNAEYKAEQSYHDNPRPDFAFDMPSRTPAFTSNTNVRDSAFQLSISPNVFPGLYATVSNTPPPLTSDSRSMQSSGIPSINGDAVEGATSMSRKNSEVPSEALMLR